jgi:hypothetical protein
MSEPAFAYDVFLSHSAKDKALVRSFSLSASNGERAGVRCRNLHLPERLRQDGLKVWFDEWEIKPGDSIPAKIEDDKPLPSTDRAWATHWPLRHDQKKAGVEREIWLWDFAGQVDYRLVHQRERLGKNGEANRLPGRAVRCDECADLAEEDLGARLNHFSVALAGLGVLVDG